MLHGLAFRSTVEIDGLVDTTPVADSYASFMSGWYKIATLGLRHYRPIGQAPLETGDRVTSTINETIDASVFEYWRNNKVYRPPNLLDWAEDFEADPSKISNAVRAHDPNSPVA